jgi:hypothetical protein
MAKVRSTGIWFISTGISLGEQAMRHFLKRRVRPSTGDTSPSQSGLRSSSRSTHQVSSGTQTCRSQPVAAASWREGRKEEIEAITFRT